LCPFLQNARFKSFAAGKEAQPQLQLLKKNRRQQRKEERKAALEQQQAAPLAVSRATKKRRSG